MSDMEKKREERRRKILANSEARMHRILGDTSKPTLEGDGALRSIAGLAEMSGVDQGSTTTSSRLCDPFKEISSESAAVSDAGDGNFVFAQPSSTASTLRLDSTQTAFPVPSTTKQDNQTKQIDFFTLKVHHFLLLALSFSLTWLLKDSYFLVYLIVYEILVFGLHSFTVPSFYDAAKTSTTLVALLLFGVPEIHRRRFRTIMIYFTWLSSDLTVFVFCSLLCYTAVRLYGVST